MDKSFKLLIVFLMCLDVSFSNAQNKSTLEDKYPIIPTPQNISYGKSETHFKWIEIVSSDFNTEADQLKEFLTTNGIGLSAEGLKIHLIKENVPVENPEEAYKLSIDTEVKIWATTENGAYYAIKTLEQIFRQKNESGILPKLEITDWPAFKIRGFMHDTGRNFQSVAQLKEQIEVLSRYKYNVFHWHLTDDPAWRLENKRYPQLQSEAATSRGKGKFYTQEDFKEILAFCKARHITVIPEFDIPGHSQAFRKAMGFQSMKDDKALPVLLDLFDELMELASPEEMPYIHIGTDEVRNRAEYVDKGFVEAIMSRVKANNRELIVWKEGIEVAGDSTSINQLWAQHAPREGHRFIDSRANYINHLDPFAGMTRLFFQQPCRQPKGDTLALGGILCAWPDNNVANERDILKQNPIYPSIVFYADAIWKGRQENKLEYWAKLPPPNTKDFEAFKAFEDKVIIHRDLFFKRKEFPYIRQTNFQWNVIGPFHTKGDVAKVFPVEDSLVASYSLSGKNYKWSEPIVGGTIHFKHFFGFPALTTEKTGTFYAHTTIYSPDDRVQDFWTGFQGWSRSGGRRVGPFPDQGQWHTTNPKIWVNGTAIAPPVWKQPSLGTKTDEIPFIDEDYFYRSPTKITLKKGWNKVLLKIPQDTNSWKWMFTCVPVAFDNGSVKEVEDLNYRAVFNVPAQVSISSFPKDYQLYPRNPDNKAVFEIAGVADPSVDSLIVKIHRAQNVISKIAFAPSGSFAVTIEIEALKHDYTVELFVKKEEEVTLIKRANHITAGDVYVLHGQSNAWAIDYDNVYNDSNLPAEAHWVRTIGAMHVYNRTAIYPEAENTNWYLASGKAPDIVKRAELVGVGMVGVLGINIGMNLVASQGVPIAIINGAGGGGAISFYQKTATTDLDVPYGRLQYRLEASGLKNHIKAFIWNQGESNADDAVIDYKKALNRLYKDLGTDYQFEKFYIIQTPPGCGSSNGHQTVREAQRQFAEAHVDVHIMTRHGFSLNPESLNGTYFLADGCHYHAHGYEQLAQWISNMANFDFYGAAIDFQAPQVVGVKLISSRTLVIEFDKAVDIQKEFVIEGIRYGVKDNLFAINDRRVSILTLTIDAKTPKKVFITLAGEPVAKGDTLTYILGDTYPNTLLPFIGPWLLDAHTGVGTVGFTTMIN